MGQLISGGGGGAAGATLAQMNIFDIDNPVAHIFSDGGNYSGVADLGANVNFLDKWVIESNNGTITSFSEQLVAGLSGIIAGGAICWVAGATELVLYPKWQVDKSLATKLSFSVDVAFADATTTGFGFGFTDIENISPTAATQVYCAKKSGASTDLKATAHSGQQGSAFTVANDTIFTFLIEVTLASNVISKVELFADGVSVSEVTASITSLPNTLVPYIGFNNASIGDDISIQNVKIFAS